MLFNSYIFILIFLPLSLAGWFGLNQLHHEKAAKVFLILMSFWFYGMFGTQFIPILLVSVFANYGFSQLSDRIAQKALRQVLEATMEAGYDNEKGSRTDAAGGWSDGDHSYDEPAFAESEEASGAREERARRERYPEERYDDPSLDEIHQDIMDAANRQQHVLMVFGILFNVLFLAVFKYGDYLLSALSRQLPWITVGGQVLSIPESLGIALPVGISFYTFSQISFIVDRCRGEVGQDDFLNYCTSVVFFPKLVEGPITGYNEIAPQFRDPERKFFRPDNFTRGFALFVFGMAKKLLIADNLAPAADFGFANTYYLDTLTAIATLMAYAFQLYFDFSGYIDMATGTAQMFNIELPLNFDSPYKAVSFGRFWQKWHMSLTRFFTKYIYIPLGGSRKGTVRTMLNVMIVFICSALWHGTGWTYLYWGVISGGLVILSNNLFRGRAERARGPIAVLLLRLLNFVMFAFTLVFFRSQSIEYALTMLRKFAFPTWPGFLFRMTNQLDLPELYIVQKAVSLYAPGAANAVHLEAFLILLAICVVLVNGKRNAYEIAQNMEMRKGTAILIGVLAAWCLLSVTGVTTFLYFKF